jgi:hypothetical protein
MWVSMDETIEVWISAATFCREVSEAVLASRTGPIRSLTEFAINVAWMEELSLCNRIATALRTLDVCLLTFLSVERRSRVFASCGMERSAEAEV